MTGHPLGSSLDIALWFLTVCSALWEILVPMIVQVSIDHLVDNVESDYHTSFAKSLEKVLNFASRNPYRPSCYKDQQPP